MRELQAVLPGTLLTNKKEVYVMSQTIPQNGENLNPAAEHPAGTETLLNGRVFRLVFQNPDFLKRFLLQVMDLSVEEVRYCTVMDEKLIGIERAALVQAEIYMDGKRSFAMVELLPEPAPALPKLARFLQGHVDRFYGREGEDNLPEDIYIVFLCDFDPCAASEKHGFARYTMSSHFEGTDIPAPDLYHLRMLNTRYGPDPECMNVPEEVRELLDYVRTGDDAMPVQGALARMAMAGVQAARASME